MHRRTIQRRKAAKWRAQSRSREYGFPIEQIYNLDDTVAWFILPRLRAFRKLTIGYPPDLTFEEWQTILDEMIAGFELYTGKDDFDMTKQDVEKIDRALQLLAKWFTDLWW